MRISKGITKKRVQITLDKDLIKKLKTKRIKLSTHINQLLWKDIALDEDKDYFARLYNVEYLNGSWKMKEKDSLIDKDFKFLYLIYNKYYDDFDNWLNKHSDGYKKNVSNVLKKSFKQHYKNFSESLRKGNYSTKYYSLAFRNLINFAVEKDLLKKSESIDIKEKLKLPRSGIDMKVPTISEAVNLLKHVKERNYIDYIFIKFLIETGLRIADIVYFFQIFEIENAEFKNNIFIYPLFNLRGNKNSFYLFSTVELYNEFIEHLDEFKNFSPERVKVYIKRNNLLCCKYTRKLNFSLMIENDVEMNIANFISGRCSPNIGFNHYLAKKKIATIHYQKFIPILNELYEKITI